ncbi:hypothetical protein BH09BAC1_BH09BAC1_11170 [soil metagenome]
MLRIPENKPQQGLYGLIKRNNYAVLATDVYLNASSNGHNFSLK